MDNYEVTIRDKKLGAHWHLMFQADDFGHALEQAEPYITDKDDEIIRIEKDYAQVQP